MGRDRGIRHVLGVAISGMSIIDAQGDCLSARFFVHQPLENLHQCADCSRTVRRASGNGRSAIRCNSCARSRNPSAVRSITSRADRRTRAGVGRDRGIRADRRALSHSMHHTRACGQPPHRQRTIRFDQVQHMALHRREIECGAARGQMFPLGEKDPHQQLPGSAGCRLTFSHATLIILEQFES